MESSEFNPVCIDQFCKLFCEEPRFKIYLVFVSVYLLEVQANTYFGFWIH